MGFPAADQSFGLAKYSTLAISPDSPLLITGAPLLAKLLADAISSLRYSMLWIVTDTHT